MEKIKFTRFYLQEDIKYEILHLDNHSGQNNYKIVAKDEQDFNIGKLEFSEYKGDIEISIIRVNPEYRNRGIGKELVRTLQNAYPKTELKWGMTTIAGEGLKNSMQSELYVDTDKRDKRDNDVKELNRLKQLEITTKKQFDDLYSKFNADESNNAIIRKQIKDLNNKYDLNDISDKITELEWSLR